MKTSSIKVLVAAVAAAIVPAGVFAQQGAGQPPPTVSVQSAVIVAESEPRSYIGWAQAVEEVQLISRVAGHLWSNNFVEGSLVKEGDLLIKIEDTIYQANTTIAAAQLVQAEADLDFARREFERHQELVDRQAVSQSVFEDARRAMLRASAQVDLSKARYDLAKNDLDYTEITAPISGKISGVFVTRGNYVSTASGTLATIVQFDPIRITFPMSERDYFNHFPTHGEMRDTRISLIRANGEEYTGDFRVLFVDNEVDENTNTIAITLECSNPNMELLPGGWVTVQVAKKYETPLVAVPLAAVMIDRTGHFVYIATGDESPQTVEKRYITIGDLVGGKQTVLDGIEAGEIVLTGGMNKVAPGSKAVAIPREIIK